MPHPDEQPKQAQHFPGGPTKTFGSAVPVSQEQRLVNLENEVATLRAQVDAFSKVIERLEGNSNG